MLLPMLGSYSVSKDKIRRRREGGGVLNWNSRETRSRGVYEHDEILDKRVFGGVEGNIGWMLEWFLMLFLS